MLTEQASCSRCSEFSGTLRLNLRWTCWNNTSGEKKKNASREGEARGSRELSMNLQARLESHQPRVCPFSQGCSDAPQSPQSNSEIIVSAQSSASLRPLPPMPSQILAFPQLRPEKGLSGKSDGALWFSKRNQFMEQFEQRNKRIQNRIYIWKNNKCQNVQEICLSLIVMKNK